MCREYKYWGMCVRLSHALWGASPKCEHHNVWRCKKKTIPTRFRRCDDEPATISPASAVVLQIQNKSRNKEHVVSYREKGRYLPSTLFIHRVVMCANGSRCHQQTRCSVQTNTFRIGSRCRSRRAIWDHQAYVWFPSTLNQDMMWRAKSAAAGIIKMEDVCRWRPIYAMRRQSANGNTNKKWCVSPEWMTRSVSS